jgi:hypothetical protein
MKASLAGGLVLVLCSACTQGAPSSSSAGAASGSPLAPTEITVPLNVSTHLIGEYETPPRDSPAQGQAIFKVSPDGLSVSYRLIASNIDNVTASHIHQGAVGSPGPPVVFLYGNAAPGGGRHDGVLATGELTTANLIGPLLGQPISALVALIESGNAYVNVHTNDGVEPTNTGPGDFPGGEIRGQL